MHFGPLWVFYAIGSEGFGEIVPRPGCIGSCARARHGWRAGNLTIPTGVGYKASAGLQCRDDELDELAVVVCTRPQARAQGARTPLNRPSSVSAPRVGPGNSEIGRCRAASCVADDDHSCSGQRLRRCYRRSESPFSNCFAWLLAYTAWMVAGWMKRSGHACVHPLPQRRVLLITGAASGLGLAVVRELLEIEDREQAGGGPGRFRIVATARPSSLEKFAAEGIVESPFVHLRPLDVTDASQRVAVVREIRERWAGVDVLVNNAGVAYRSVVEDVESPERLAQMDVNFLAPMALARQVLPDMRAKMAGHIINVSSVGGMMAMPTMSAYSASKFALEGATESMWYEVRPWKIRVTLVEPGFISSDSFQNTRYTAASRLAMYDPRAAYHAHYLHMAEFIARLMRKTPYTSQSVARTIVRTMQRRHPPLRVPATLDAHLFALLRRLLPRRLYHELLYRALPGVQSWGPKEQCPGPDALYAPEQPRELEVRE